MSISTQPNAARAGASGKHITFTTLILSLALAVSTTAAIFFAFHYFHQTAAVGGGGNAGTPAADEALVQKGSVSPRSNGTEIVYYDTPFLLSPPNLKLMSPQAATTTSSPRTKRGLPGSPGPRSRILRTRR